MAWQVESCSPSAEAEREGISELTSDSLVAKALRSKRRIRRALRLPSSGAFTASAAKHEALHDSSLNDFSAVPVPS